MYNLANKYFAKLPKIVYIMYISKNTLEVSLKNNNIRLMQENRILSNVIEMTSFGIILMVKQTKYKKSSTDLKIIFAFHLSLNDPKNSQHSCY